MRFFIRSLCFLSLCLITAGIAKAADSSVESISDISTHKQTRLIKFSDSDDPDGKPASVNAFCLDASGNIVAACGTGPGEIRVVDKDGKKLQSWSLDIKPESVHVSPNGTVLVGGEGKLMRFDAEGKELANVDSPHAISLRSNNETLREEAIKTLNRSKNALGARIEMYQRIITMLEEKSEKQELSEQETKMLESLPKTLAMWVEQAEAERLEKEKNKEAGVEEDEGPGEAEIQASVDRMIQSKLRISSVTSNSDHVFVTTRSQAGYGFDVWKMTADLTDGEVIVSGLSGCCGQMDVQCCNVDSAAGLFVAENSRGRVVRYDFAGEELTKWGKKDRSGKDGFSSCCNPMNVCFSGSGDVFTAEASTGRIKRFSPEGTFLAYVGDVELVPGCKNVSIAVSPNDDTVYMLDLTRNHIAVMQPKSDEEKAADQRNNDEKAAANDTESSDDADSSNEAPTDEVAVK